MNDQKKNSIKCPLQSHLLTDFTFSIAYYDFTSLPKDDITNFRRKDPHLHIFSRFQKGHNQNSLLEQKKTKIYESNKSKKVGKE